MKRLLLSLAVMLLAIIPSRAAETGFDEVAVSCTAVIVTGVCSTFNIHPPDYVHIPSAQSFTWQTIIAGGTATSLSVTLEGSLDGTTWTTLDTSTNTSGELRQKTSQEVKYFRCNVGAYSRNGTTLTCQIMATARGGGGAGVGTTGAVVEYSSDTGSLAASPFTDVGGVFTISGAQIAAFHLANGVTGSGQIVLKTSPALVTPDLGDATYSTLTGTSAAAGSLDLPKGNGTCQGAATDHGILCYQTNILKLSLNNGSYLQVPQVNADNSYIANGNTIQAAALINAYCALTVGTASATAYYLFPGGNASAAACTTAAGTETPIPEACTVKGFYVKASAAGAVAGSGVMHLTKNTVNTAVTCTLGTGTTCNDPTNTATYAAGDTWAVTVTTGQATDTTANLRVSFKCQ